MLILWRSTVQNGGYGSMKLITTILLIASISFAITAGEISAKHDELLQLMDKFTWETYENPYTGEEVTITATERNAIKQQAIACYNEHKDMVVEYAQQLGLI